MFINLLCPWDLNGRFSQHTQVTPCERQQLAQEETALERECERRGSSVLSKLQIAWKTGPAYWQAWDLLKPVLSPTDTPGKERGNTLVTTVCSNLTIYPKKCCVDWSTATAQSLLPDVPRQGDTRTGSHVLALQPWQSRATSMLSWEAGGKGNPFILTATAPTILCCLFEDKPNFDSIDSTRIWPATLQKLVSVRDGACLCSPKVIAVESGLAWLFYFCWTSQICWMRAYKKVCTPIYGFFYIFLTHQLFILPW